MATSDTGAIAAPLPTAHSTSDPSRWSALPVLLAGAFMVVLDFFIVNVALPAIATDLGASESSLEWVDRRLRARLRGVPDHRRAPRRPVRPPARLRGRARPVHAHLARLRAGAEPDGAGDRPRRPGRLGGDPDAAGAVDDRGHLPGRRPRPGAGDLRHGPRPRRRRRAADRRRAGADRLPRPRLARLLPDQRADRARRAARRAAAGARVARLGVARGERRADRPRQRAGAGRRAESRCCCR